MNLSLLIERLRNNQISSHLAVKEASFILDGTPAGDFLEILDKNMGNLVTARLDEDVRKLKETIVHQGRAVDDGKAASRKMDSFRAEISKATEILAAI